MKRLLQSMTRAFPAPFREQFGAEVSGQINIDYDRARAQGISSALMFSIITAIDLTRSGVAERWNPTVVRPHTTQRGEKSMLEKLNEWITDLRHATRSLRRSPGFAVVTVGTLGLAIGANAGMFSVVNSVLLNPLPYKNADRLMYIAATAPGSDLPPQFGVSYEFFVHYKEHSQTLEDLAAYDSFTSTFKTNDRAERIRMSEPTNSLFSTLGAKPILGRTATASDHDDVMVISYALWKDWFNKDSSVIGKTYTASGGKRTIIGVMGPEFKFPSEDTQMWLSVEEETGNLRTGRFGVDLVGRMKPGVTKEALTTELTKLSKQLPERFGGTAAYAKVIEQHRAVALPLKDQLVGKASTSLWVLFGAVAIVLMIACANVANLFMVRAEGRLRDLAVRRAIGATRFQLIRSQMSEAAIIAALAGVTAAVLAWVSLPALLRAAPRGVHRLNSAGMDPTTISFTLGLAVLAALACGLLPAVKASAPDMRRLREGGRGATRRTNWTRDGLVVGQTALALVLLIGSGLLLRSFLELRAVNPGYDTKDVFTFQIAPDNISSRDGRAMARFHTDFMKRLETLPGVQTVGIVENIPLNEGTSTGRYRGEESTDIANGPLLHYTYTAGNYFKAMGIKVKSGRTFTEDDHFVSHGNVVISQSIANQLFPGKDPIGRRLQAVGGENEWSTVIGVVDDVMQDDFRTKGEATIYFPILGPTDSSWSIGTPAYVIKTSRASAIAPEIRALVKEVSPGAPMYRVFTLEGLAADSMTQLSFTMLTLGIASMLALILGAVGLYGVLSYVVAARTREIGVRMALGAEAGQVRRMVVVQGTRVVLVGVAVGAVVAGASAKALSSLLFGVAAFDPATFSAMSLSLIVVGMLASYLPARRASNVDPLESLRSE
ncbi:MAG: ABC transporter permease [Gemmatimonas sp.]